MRAPTTTQTHFVIKSPQARVTTLNALTDWKISGAVSITVPQQQPEIANYTWIQQPQHYQIILNSALDLYQIVILKNKNTITLTKNNKLLTQASTPEKLMQNAVGWSLPVEYLQYWIKGIPVPNQPYQATYDRFGHLVRLKQAGFTVHYQRYQTISNDLDLPQLISVQSPALFAKILIKQFTAEHS